VGRAPTDLTASERTADRAARNSAVRAVAELVAKFASLALVFVLARHVGVDGLGVYVFAFAWAEVANIPVDMGFDRFLTRQVARDRRAIDSLMANVVAVKLLRAGPVLVASFVLVNLLGYSADTCGAVYAAAVGVIFESLVNTVLAAALGLGALAAGLGVVAVLVGFAVAAASALVLAASLLVTHVGRPRLALSREGRRETRSRTFGFAAQEVFATGIARADTILLSLLGSTAAVGIYGAGYRLLESSLFIPLALTTAFAAMFTYLGRDSEPSVGAAYGYALKAALILLVPCAVVLFVLAEPVLALFFGDGFEGATTPLRLLAPVVVLLGAVIISTSLVISRRDPRAMVWAFAAALGVNVAANLLLIPAMGASGAALGMLITYGLFALVAFEMAARAVGHPPLISTLGGPLVAGGAMALALMLLHSSPPLAAFAGVLVYLAVLVVVEWRLSPRDLRFATDMLRRYLPSSTRNA